MESDESEAGGIRLYFPSYFSQTREIKHIRICSVSIGEVTSTIILIAQPLSIITMMTSLGYLQRRHTHGLLFNWYDICSNGMYTVVLCFIYFIYLYPWNIFMYERQGCFTGTWAIVRLSPRLWRNSEWYGWNHPTRQKRTTKNSNCVHILRDIMYYYKCQLSETVAETFNLKLTVCMQPFVWYSFCHIDDG